MKYFILFLILSTVIPYNSVCAEVCLDYEPAVINLQGKLILQTFAGSPSYNNIQTGDQAETYFILLLKKEICVKGRPSEEINVSEDHIKKVQLVIDQNEFDRYKSYLFKDIIVAGSLFHSHTGHHHTKVLLIVQDIDIVL